MDQYNLAQRQHNRQDNIFQLYPPQNPVSFFYPSFIESTCANAHAGLFYITFRLLVCKRHFASVSPLLDQNLEILGRYQDEAMCII